MKTDEVEKIMKRKLDPDKQLSEQTTADEYAEICFHDEIEIEILIQKGMVDKTKTDEEIEKEVKDKFTKLLNDSKGNYRKALQALS